MGGEPDPAVKQIHPQRNTRGPSSGEQRAVPRHRPAGSSAAHALVSLTPPAPPDEGRRRRGETGERLRHCVACVLPPRTGRSQQPRGRLGLSQEEADKCDAMPMRVRAVATNNPPPSQTPFIAGWPGAASSNYAAPGQPPACLSPPKVAKKYVFVPLFSPCETRMSKLHQA